MTLSQFIMLKPSDYIIYSLPPYQFHTSYLYLSFISHIHLITVICHSLPQLHFASQDTFYCCQLTAPHTTHVQQETCASVILVDYLKYLAATSPELSLQ